MRKYWFKIGFGALLIFVVGFGMMTGVRRVKNKITSSQDIEIPLGPFIGFNRWTKLGTIRTISSGERAEGPSRIRPAIRLAIPRASPAKTHSR